MTKGGTTTRHDDGNARHDNGDGRHDDGWLEGIKGQHNDGRQDNCDQHNNGQQGDRQHDDCDERHDNADIIR